MKVQTCTLIAREVDLPTTRGFSFFFSSQKLSFAYAMHQQLNP